jgi:hypothetical protein
MNSRVLLVLPTLLLSLLARNACAARSAPGTNAQYLQAALAREILSPALVLSEVQDYLEPRVPTMPALNLGQRLDPLRQPPAR